MRKTVSVLIAAAFLISAGLTLSFAQEIPTAAEAQTQWLWGEVVSVNTQNNEVVVKYLDYETEEEKEIVITVNDETVYENVSTLSEITAQDAVSIDYIVSAEGKNIAKHISVEKPEVPLAPQEEEVIPVE